RERVLRHDARAQFVRNDEGRRVEAAYSGDELLDGALDRSVVGALDEIAEPERDAVDHRGVEAAVFTHRPRDLDRRLDGRPFVAPARAMRGDALRHLIVAGLGRCDVEQPRARFARALLGVAAVAGARSAGDQNDSIHVLLAVFAAGPARGQGTLQNP